MSQYCHSRVEAGMIGDRKSMLADGGDYMIINFKETSTEVIINKYTKPMADDMLIAQNDSIDVASIYAAFEDLLEDVVGKDVFNAFAESYPDHKQDVAEKLKILDTRAQSDIRFSGMSRLFRIFEEMKGTTLKKALKESKYSKDVKYTYVGGPISISSHLVRGFYDKPVIQTCVLLKSTLQAREADKIKCVFMTGNLAGMCEFQRVITAAFTDIHFVFPDNVGLAAMQGAVIHAYKQMTSR